MRFVTSQGFICELPQGFVPVEFGELYEGGFVRLFKDKDQKILRVQQISSGNLNSWDITEVMTEPKYGWSTDYHSILIRELMD